MKKRGKILRHPGSGPGIVIIEGQQHRFSLGEVWNSEVPPRKGMSVEATFDASSRITSLHPVADHEVAEVPTHRFMDAVKGVSARLLRKITRR